MEARANAESAPPIDAASPLQLRDWLALLFVMAIPTIGAWLYFVLLAGHPMMKLAYSGSKIIQFAFPLFWVLIVQRTRIGLTPPTRGGIRIGLGFGLLVVAVMLSAYWAYFKQSDFLAEADVRIWKVIKDIGATTPALYVAMAMFIAVFHSLFEEYYWRWFVFGQLRRSLPFWAAAAISSLAFMAHHIIVIGTYLRPEHWPVIAGFSLAVATGGFAWSWIYERSRSLIGPWLSHLIVDAGLMIIGFDLCRRHWQ